VSLNFFAIKKAKDWSNLAQTSVLMDAFDATFLLNDKASKSWQTIDG